MLEPRNKKSGQRVVGAADSSLLYIDTPTIMESNSISYSNIVKQCVNILVKPRPICIIQPRKLQCKVIQSENISIFCNPETYLVFQ